MTGIEFDYLTQILAPLTNLRYLLLMSDDFLSSNGLSPSKIIPLPSVQILYIRIKFYKDHKALALRHWNHIFPSLQIVVIYQTMIYRCSFCPGGKGGLYFGISESDWDSVGECVHQLMQPFKQCTKLRKIFHYFNRQIREFGMNDF